MNKSISNNSMMKMIYFNLMIMCCLISSMTSSLYIMWILMEINTFIFIAYSMMKKNNLMSTINYFMIQIIGSIIIMFILTLNINMELNVMYEKMIMTLILSLKLGIIPFYQWIIFTTKYFSWDSIFLMNTIQKFIPFMFLYKANFNMMIFLSILTMLISCILNYNNINTKMIIGYSSMLHTAWMSSLILIDKNFFIIYFLIYTILTYLICKICKFMNFNNLNNFSIIKFKNKEMMIMFMLNYSGLPPFLSFLTKWISLNYFMKNSLMMFSLISMLSSIIFLTSYFYMFFLMNYSSFNLLKNKISYLNINIFMFFIILSPILMLMI